MAALQNKKSAVRPFFFFPALAEAFPYFAGFANRKRSFSYPRSLLFSSFFSNSLILRITLILSSLIS